MTVLGRDMDVVTNPRMVVTVKIRRNRKGGQDGSDDNDDSEEEEKEKVIQYPATVSNILSLDYLLL